MLITNKKKSALLKQYPTMKNLKEADQFPEDRYVYMSVKPSPKIIKVHQSSHPVLKQRHLNQYAKQMLTEKIKAGNIALANEYGEKNFNTYNVNKLPWIKPKKQLSQNETDQ